MSMLLLALGVLTAVSRGADPIADPRPPFSRFAAAVAIAGDQILIGRAGLSARTTAAPGGVHVFTVDQKGRWTETAVIAPGEITAKDQFGAALAVDGMLLAVGAPGAADGRGAVYVFERGTKRGAPGQWVMRAKLAPAAAAPGSNFGQALALRNGILLIGAPGHANHRGAAVVFRQGAKAHTWVESTTLQPADTSRARFGRAVAIAGGRLFVGAPGQMLLEQGDEVPGQVTVFRDSSGTWVEDARLAVTDEPGVQGLGMALAADSATVWVSSPSQNVVYEFQRDATGRWVKAAALRAASEQAAMFGMALAHEGQYLVIGAALDDNRAGAVHIFQSDSSRAPWTERPRLPVPAGMVVPEAFGWFGTSLALGNGLLVAGTPQQLYGDGFAAAYRLDVTRSDWQLLQVITDTAWNLWKKPLTGAPIPCQAGKAGVFDCRHVELLSYLPAAAIGGDSAVQYFVLTTLLNDVWGWSDSASGREFALVGRVDGTAFVEVTDPVRPRYLGNLPRHQGARRSAWRDIKVYKNHAFIVSDNAGSHGMQVFDLTQLRNVKAAPAVFQETAHYSRIASAHTIAIDTAAGFAYVVGSNGEGETCGGGLHMIDIRNPSAPAFAGCYAETLGGSKQDGYIHETECVVYHGPDQRYHGREICLNAAVTAVGIVDVTDKHEPKPISVAAYPNARFTHQGWLSEDQRFFFLGDEADEGDGRMTRTVVFDLQDLDDPVVVREFRGTTVAIDHNLYVRGRYMYQANYLAGLRVVDVKDPANPMEVGYFDTTPYSEIAAHFGGAWSVYPYFKMAKDGVLAVSSLGEGLFLLRFRPPKAP